MLKVPILAPHEVDRAVTIFHRDGFVCVKDILTPEQLKYVQAGAARVIKEQTDADPDRKGNRGSYRYSFGHQTHHPEWCVLVDLPLLLPIIEKIWGSPDFTCTGAGGDYSLPKAEMQGLHKDMGDFFNDPQGVVTHHDCVAPFIVVNFMMVNFTKENGAIRFVPCTQRSRAPIPGVADEPEWMQESIVCAPAGTAVIRDVRCWHGGTPNNSDHARPMTSVGYYAPWRRPLGEKRMPRKFYDKLSPRGQELCKYIVGD